MSNETYDLVVQTVNTLYGIIKNQVFDGDKNYRGKLVGFTRAQKGTEDWVNACYAKPGELENQPEKGMRMVMNLHGDTNIITTQILEIYYPKSSE
ncbi:MAG: hypothetical protein N3D75_00345 [Candidatus Aenigmarchaeota archaeon]|nr:hypothetical protein [Candidatus Aenigmarchaeota archaeon]